MSWAGSINTDNCFERYSFDQSFAPSPRRNLLRSASSSVVPTRRNLISGSSRSQSASPAPSKRSFFSRASMSSKSERSSSVPNIASCISAPVLVSSTNPLVAVSQETTCCDSSEERDSRQSVQISDILADLEDDDDEDFEEEEETEPFGLETRYATSLSPPPSTNRPTPTPSPSPTLSQKLKNRHATIPPPQIQIHHPQPRSHFSLWSVASSDDNSRASSPTESEMSRRDSVTSCYSISSTPDSETFEYNPYISKVSERGFKNGEEAMVGPLTPASFHDQQQATALEEYLSDLGFI